MYTATTAPAKETHEPNGWCRVVRGDILPRLAPPQQVMLAGVLDEGATAPAPWQEIRLRAGRPLCIVTAQGEWWPGRSTVHPGGERVAAGVVSASDIAETLARCADRSVYAWEAELAQGFLTLPGGHRVGVAGRVVWGIRGVESIRDINGLCIRVARSVPGAAAALVAPLLDGARVRTSLIFSPPGCGKTTVLRDLVRHLSEGTGNAAPGRRVVVVDERMELAACRGGLPQLDVGRRTDVLDGCPKHVGMAIALRALGPDVLATDEIGRDEDATAILDAARAGVSVLATAHAGSVEELRTRPTLARLLDQGVFERLVRLSRTPRPGHIAEIRNVTKGRAA